MKTTKRSKRWAMAGIAVLLLVVLGIIGIHRSEREDSANRTSQPTYETPAAQSSTVSGAGLRWRTGSAQRYRVQFDSAMRMDAAGTPGAQTLRVMMDCALDWQTLEVGGQTVLVGMQLSAVDLRVNGNADPQTNQALSAPFRVRYAATGLPQAFEFPDGVSAQHRGMLENIVRTFQVAVEADEAWVAWESKASGTYEAAYRRTEPLKVEKTKTHFVAPPTAGVSIGTEIVSREEFRLDPQRDWIAAMTVDEVVKTGGKDGLAMQITNLATLERLSVTKPVAADTWDFATTAAPPGLETKKSVPTISPQEARQQILAVLPELDAATEGRTPWIHRLRDLLRADDALPAMLLEQMQTQPLSDRTRADLYLALELAGTESAQAALVSVIDDNDWSSLDAMRAIVALASVSQPSADTIDALWDTVESAPADDNHQQLAATATLALGSIGSTLHAADDPDYALLRERLLDGALTSMGSDRYTAERTTYVHAMGNTGDSSLTSDLVSFLDDKAPAVRRAAALSLGVLGADSVADDLMWRFNQEESSAVRGAIAESLVSWTKPSPSAMRSVGDDILNEPDENTRYHMARFLGANMESFPENKAILKNLLRTEKSKRIRRQVAETLAASR